MAFEGGTLGGRIRQRRRELGLRLDDLATAVPSNISTLSRIETDKRSPTVEELGRIASALHCVPTDLIPGPQARKPPCRGAKRKRAN